MFTVPFIFLAGGFLSRSVANLRWRYVNGDDAEWGDKGRYQEYKK